MSEKEDLSGRVGGTSAMDDAIRPLVSNAVGRLLDLGLDIKPIKAMMAALSPSVRQAMTLLPVAVGGGFARLPLSLFGSKTVAHLLQDVFVEASRHIARKAQEAGGEANIPPEEYAKAVDAGVKEAVSRYVTDPIGLVHRNDCGRCAQAYKKEDLKSADIKHVISSGALCAPCCFEHVQAQVKSEAPHAAPKPAPRSAAEVFSRATAGQRKVLFGWYNGLTAERQAEFGPFIKQHLDSTEELEMLVDAIENMPETIEFVISLLENTNVGYQRDKLRHYAAAWFKAAWNGSKHGVVEAWKFGVAQNAELNVALQPVVDRLENRKGSKGQPISALTAVIGERRKPRPGFFASLFRIL